MKHAVNAIVDFVEVIAYLQVKVRLNLHGVVGVESVQQVDEEEYEEKVKRPVAKVNMLFSRQHLLFIASYRTSANLLRACMTSVAVACLKQPPDAVPVIPHLLAYSSTWRHQSQIIW